MLAHALHFLFIFDGREMRWRGQRCDADALRLNMVSLDDVAPRVLGRHEEMRSQARQGAGLVAAILPSQCATTRP